MNVVESRRLVISLCALALGVAACTPTGGGTAVDTEADAQAIRDLSSAWLEHANGRDADAIAAYFAPEGIVLEEGEPPIVGAEAIRADIEEDWAENPDFAVDWRTISVRVAESGDLAWERGQWTFDPDGAGARPDVSGEYITVWEKVDGEWKVAADIGVPTEPMPAAEGAEGDTAAGEGGAGAGGA